jgi:hypothetical protein
MFLRGRKQKIPEVRATIVLRSNDLTPLKEGKLVTLGGDGPAGTLDFTIFGKTLKVPYRIEGLDVKIENAEKVLELIEKGVKELPVVMKSTTGQLFVLYQPPTVESMQSLRKAI